MDESGDPGPHKPPKPGEKRRSAGVSPTPTYTVSAVLVEDAQWVEIFEKLLGFRRWLREHYGLPLNAEVKGAQLATGDGIWRKLKTSKDDREKIYRLFMQFQDKYSDGLQTYAVVVWKDKCGTAKTARSLGWQYAFERVETFAYKHGKTRIMLLPDSGQYHWIRALARKMRRFAYVPAHYSSGPLDRKLLNVLLDDPVERDSAQSLMIQLADVNAYAAFRNRVPRPGFPDMWAHLGTAIAREANKFDLEKDPTLTPGIKDAPSPP